MLTWKISTGELFGPDGSFWAKGYSGHFEGVNNPAKESQPNVGPIPEGKYAIGDPYDSDKVGKFALPLNPLPGTNTYGRSDFRIHGDLVRAVGQRLASHGCIILAKAVREKINAITGFDRILLVIA
jgi:hypothetical protein